MVLCKEIKSILAATIGSHFEVTYPGPIYYLVCICEFIIYISCSNLLMQSNQHLCDGWCTIIASASLSVVTAYIWGKRNEKQFHSPKRLIRWATDQLTAYKFLYLKAETSDRSEHILSLGISHKYSVYFSGLVWHLLWWFCHWNICSASISHSRSSQS